MQIDTRSTTLLEAEGAIESINAPGREMSVVVQGTLCRFDIAGECSIWLHGERVKLRILQAADLVHISYLLQDGEAVATEIRVLK